MSSRIENTTKNILWSTLNTILITLLGFVSRTVFIHLLGATYLGVNGLFTNILSVLSFAELGIGAAITFSLYKPLADNDLGKIQALMYFYKRAYQMIALIVLLLGLSIFPFLDQIVKGAEGIKHIPIIYLIFLFNTTYSYLFSYKRSLLYADQKSYLLTRITIVINIVTLITQIIALFLFKNYFAFLITGVVTGVIQNFYINHYIDKKYPYLLDNSFTKLSKEDKEPILKNVKAMIYSKIGDISINQTDNILISSFINVTLVGLISNYNLIIESVNSFIGNIFNSATASFGNLIATESEEKRLTVFKGYNFLSFWFYGWATVCFYHLINPFIVLWIGVDKTISQTVINLIIFNNFLVGMRIPVINVKAAAGLYVQDRFIPILQAAINLVISIVGVKYWGLAGVYVGTIVSSLPTWYRPIIIYRYVFKISPKEYFVQFFKYLFVVFFNISIVSIISNFLFNQEISLISFIGTGILCLTIPNLIIVFLYRKTSEYKYIMHVLSFFGRKFAVKKFKKAI